MPSKRKKFSAKQKNPTYRLLLGLGMALLVLGIAKVVLLKQAQVFLVSQPTVVVGVPTAVTSTGGVTGRMIPTSPVPTPIASCVPRPSCLDAVPACKLPITANMCPAPVGTTIPRPSASPLPSGCYYQQVKCFQAPCNPILVCATSTRPSPTPIPMPPSPVASAFPSPVPSLWPSPSPSPTSLYTNQLASLQALDPCGPDSFRIINYTCNNGAQATYGAGTCSNLTVAIKAIQSICGNALGVK